MAEAVHERIRLSPKGATNQRHKRQPNPNFVLGVRTLQRLRTRTGARVVTQLGVGEWTVTKNVERCMRADTFIPQAHAKWPGGLGGEKSRTSPQRGSFKRPTAAKSPGYHIGVLTPVSFCGSPGTNETTSSPSSFASLSHFAILKDTLI